MEPIAAGRASDMNEGGPPATFGSSASPLVLPHAVTGQSPATASGKNFLSDGAALLCVASFVVLLASLLLPLGGVPGIETCSFHAVTGLPCPGCGLTRAFCAISRGHFHDAWNFHPFAFPLYTATLAGAAAPLLRRNFPALSGAAASKALRVAILVFGAGMLLFGILRAKRQWDASRAGAPATLLQRRAG